MIRLAVALLAAGLAVGAVGAPARADEVALDQPTVEIRDLPPLPESVADDRGTAVAVASAQRAEETVVIGAAKREQSLGTVASAVTVLPGDRLRRFGYATPSQALRSVAGLYVTDDRMNDRLGFRGLQILGDFNTRTLVLVDGVTINEPFNQYVGIGYDSPIHIDDVDRIEVIRGPVSSLYGTNAFFGIINIITRSADRSPRAYGRITGGNHGTVLGTAGFATGTVDRQVRGNVSYANIAGETLSYPAFEAAGEDTMTSADGLESFQGAVVARFDGWFAQVRGYSRERELPGAPYETLVDDPTNRDIDRHLLGEVGHTRVFDDRLTITGRGYFQRYQFLDFLAYAPDPEFRDEVDSMWFGGELRGRYEIIDDDRFGITAGLEATFNEVRSSSFEVGFEPDAVDVETDSNVQGVYLEADGAPASWMAVSAGLRFDRNSLFEDNVSPRAALLLHHRQEYGAKLLYAQGFRFPSAYEAFFEDGVDFIANPDLDPERIRAYEVVLWSNPRPGLDLRLSGFRWEASDLIEQEEVETPDPRLQFRNNPDMTSTGMEAEAAYRDTRGWLGFASLGLSHVERDGVVSDALNAPLVVAALGVSTPAIRSLVHVSTEAQFVSDRRTRDPSVETDPFVAWNAAIYLPAWRSIDVTLGVRNILGVREDVPAQEDYDRSDEAGDSVVVPFVPGDGRHFYVRLGYTY